MATACLGFFTIGAFLPDPACRVPALNSRITFDTLASFAALVLGFFMRLESPSSQRPARSCVDSQSFHCEEGIRVKLGNYFIDLLPRHFHLRRDRLFGEFGSDFQSPLILADRAQYAEPLAVPGRILSPPSFAGPAWPYLMVRVRPVLGFLTTLVNLFSITVQLGIRIQKRGLQAGRSASNTQACERFVAGKSRSLHASKSRLHPRPIRHYSEQHH